MRRALIILGVLAAGTALATGGTIVTHDGTTGGATIDASGNLTAPNVALSGSKVISYLTCRSASSGSSGTCGKFLPVANSAVVDLQLWVATAGTCSSCSATAGSYAVTDGTTTCTCTNLTSCTSTTPIHCACSNFTTAAGSTLTVSWTNLTGCTTNPTIQNLTVGLQAN